MKSHKQVEGNLQRHHEEMAIAADLRNPCQPDNYIKKHPVRTLLIRQYLQFRRNSHGRTSILPTSQFKISGKPHIEGFGLPLSTAQFYANCEIPFSVIWILQGWMNRCIHILSALP